MPLEPFFKILFLLLFSGGLAYLGDKIGTKIGRKRLRIFGMRPKNTAIFITIATGMIITSISLIFILVFSREARDGLFHLSAIRQRNRVLKSRYLEFSKKVVQADQKFRSYQKQILNSKKTILANEKKIDVLLDSNKGLIKEREELLLYYNDRIKGQKSILARLNEEKITLQVDVSRLNEQLQQKSQQQVIFNKGEILAFSVLPSEMASATLKIKLISLIHTAIEKAKSKGSSAPKIEDFWQKNAIELEKTLTMLTTYSATELVVVVASGHNVVKGEELKEIKFRFRPNTVVFKKGDVIARTQIPAGLERSEIAEKIQKFLDSDINEVAMKKGMLFDPMTRKIGSMGIKGMLALSDMSQKIADSPGEMEIIFMAREAIPVSGPLAFSVKFRPSN